VWKLFARQRCASAIVPRGQRRSYAKSIIQSSTAWRRVGALFGEAEAHGVGAEGRQRLACLLGSGDRTTAIIRLARNYLAAIQLAAAVAAYWINRV
jgi:hypothetical protein